MTPGKPLSSASQILDLLAQEKAALLTGDIECLEAVSALKQAWVDDLPEHPLSLSFEEIQKIKCLSDENAAVSEACQRAQKSVIEHLRSIRKIQKTMGIYAVDGTFSETDSYAPQVETRS